jgi:hypothetical protein
VNEMSFFMGVGGTPIGHNSAQPFTALPTPFHNAYSFGWSYQPEKVSAALQRIGDRGGYTNFDQVAGKVANAWDGQSTVPLWKAAVNVTGRLLPARRQSRGVCTSCGWASAATLRRCLQLDNAVYTGKMTIAQAQAAFYTFSHAIMYGLGKEVANDLGAQNRSERGDGCYGAAMAEASHRWGFVTNDVASDSDDNDDLAIQYAISGVPAEFKAKAQEHAADTVPVTSVAQAFDILASGHPIAVCSSQGFSMTRDAMGFCSPLGRWDHCMHWMGIVVAKVGAWGSPSGAGGSRLRRGPVNGQSWGQNTPEGPLVSDAPDYAFGIDEAIAEHMLQMKDTFAIASVAGFEPVPVVVDQYY